jgi:3-deoxy-D-manno-octulosonic-acid transferase
LLESWTHLEYSADSKRRSIVYLLYNLLLAVGVIVLGPYYAIRGWRQKKYWSSFSERAGKLSPEILQAASSSSGSIWIHAVSVGEVLAVESLANQLRAKHPKKLIFISTTTDTGQRLARERLKGMSGFFYFPFDWPPVVKKVFRDVNPELVIIVETEIWPNFLREAQRRNIPLAFVNARISERSFKRLRIARHFFSVFFARVLSGATLFLAQSDADAERLRAIGAPEELVEVAGNMKYDSESPVLGDFSRWLTEQVKTQERWPVVVAGSVVADEEESVLAAFDVVQRQWRRSLLVLAPRKPASFDSATKLAAQRGWNVVRRTSIDLNGGLDVNADLLLLDSIGELAGIYSLADVVFVGGSLVNSGGHNILEPAWFGRVPVFGYSMENFRDMARQFRAEDAGVQVRSSNDLAQAWVKLIQDETLARRMGEKAKSVAQRNRGATQRCFARIEAILAGQSSQKPQGAQGPQGPQGPQEPRA